MKKVLFSLNFMHCMERFATQIYRTQRGAFTGTPLAQQLTDASDNEKTHVWKLHSRIKALKGRVYPLGWLFQLAGFVLGVITRVCGKRCILKADIFVEKRAVKDYTGFLNSVHFGSDTVAILRGIIADEHIHISNWQRATESKLY
jgi:demethoxyubiquinone hydroxylase (CLK1/Coq7/Cat5 family)